MFILSHKMINLQVLGIRTGFPGDSDGKGSACSVGDLGLIPGLKDPLEERMATHSSILAWRIPVDIGAWQVTVHSVTKSQEKLDNLACINIYMYVF